MVSGESTVRWPVPEQRRHGAQQPRRVGNLKARIGDPEPIQPADFGPQPPDHAEGIEDPQEKGSDDDPVKARIGHKGPLHMGIKDDGKDTDDQHEYDHADEIDFGQFEDSRLSNVGHGRLWKLKRAVNDVKSRRLHGGLTASP